MTQLDGGRGGGGAKAGGVDRDLNAHRLTMLMDYTKFHIGLYATLVTALLAIANLGGDGFVTPELRRGLYLPVGLVLLAGMCGGIIAGNLPEQTSFNEFWNGWTGPWGREWFRTRRVARAEHLFFWLAVVSGIAVTFWLGTPPNAELRAHTKAGQSASPQVQAPDAPPRDDSARGVVAPAVAPVVAPGAPAPAGPAAARSGSRSDSRSDLD